MRELFSRQREATLALIDALDDPLIARAIVTGAATGRVWVDDPAQPHSAFFWDEDANLCLVGASDNTAFNQELARLLEDTLLPAAVQKRIWGYDLRYGPAAWKLPLRQDLLAYLAPIEDQRLHFVHPAPETMVATDHLPEGLALLPVDADFLTHEEWLNIDEVHGWMRQCWASTEAYLADGFGYALVDEMGLVSWCLAEYVSQGVCSLGIETDAEHRGQGLGTLIGRVTLAECARRGLEPHWDCWENNAASARVASKLGFRLQATYSVFFGWWNQVDQLAIRGNVALRRGQPAEAVALIEQALALFEGSLLSSGLADDGSVAADSLMFQRRGAQAAWWYVTAARTRMQLGDLEAAMAHLGGALDSDWRGARALGTADEWAPLHQVPGWSTLVARIAPPPEPDEET